MSCPGLAALRRYAFQQRSKMLRVRCVCVFGSVCVSVLEAVPTELAPVPVRNETHTLKLVRRCYKCRVRVRIR
jgi:hypothetical protein